MSTLKPGILPKAQRRSAVPRHLLALAGGGYRGLFTAKVLAAMENGSTGPIASRFDLIGGTSIGGILAIGIACGISASCLVELIREHGPRIFRPKRLSLWGLASARYDSLALRAAFETILGKPFANRAFAEIPARLLVVAIDERTSAPRLFRTNELMPSGGDKLATIEVALATSAAPTFFSPHIVGDEAFVDGGLIANAPDLVMIGEATRAFGAKLSEIHLCSIGTCSSERVGEATGHPGSFGWLMRHKLIELIMDAQAALTAEQVDCVSPATVLRIDRKPSRRIALDDVEERTTRELMKLAERAYADVQCGAKLQRFLKHTPQPW